MIVCSHGNDLTIPGLLIVYGHVESEISDNVLGRPSIPCFGYFALIMRDNLRTTRPGNAANFSERLDLTTEYC